MKPCLYISGPISKGNMFANFVEFCATFQTLIEKDFAPLNPGLSMLLPGNQQIPWETWIAIDLAWVAKADVVFRIPGESEGADQETRLAELKGIPVFTRWHDLMAWKQTWEASHGSVANGT